MVIQVRPAVRVATAMFCWIPCKSGGGGGDGGGGEGDGGGGEGDGGEGEGGVDGGFATHSRFAEHLSANAGSGQS